MTSDRHTDVLIVGAGPAGTTMAEHLARRGIRSLILEKNSLSEGKPCGGGLTEKTMALLGADAESLVEDRCPRFQSSYRGVRDFAIDAGRPLIFMARRRELDSFLLQRARDQGADFQDGVVVKGVVASGDRVEAHTSAGPFYGRYIAGGDGAASVVARSLKLRTGRHLGRGVVCEFVPADRSRLETFQGKITMDFGVVPRGYGWVFPKRDHLNVGIFTQQSDLRGLKGYLERYFKLRLAGWRKEDFAQLTPRYHPLPLGGRPGPLHASRGLLLGDAAGLVDPLTGEGIYFAVRSGQVAAEVVAAALEGGGPEILASYSERIHRETVRNFQASWAISAIFYRIPGLSFRLITRPGVVRAYQRSSSKNSRSGEIPYARLLRDLLTLKLFRNDPGP